VDDVRIGRILRALRRRRGWTQAELAVHCGVSQQAISLVERGHGSKLATATLRRIFSALDARWEPTVSWRGGDLDRLLDEAHAGVVAATVRRLQALEWQVAVEVTYSEFGERGSIDVLGARRDLMAMAIIEVKSELTVVDATVRKLDEKVRIVRGSLGRDRFGFTPRHVGRVLILPATETARRRVRMLSAVLEAALPDRGTTVRQWLRRPDGQLAGILFLSDTNPRGGTSRGGGSKRVRRRNASTDRAVAQPVGGDSRRTTTRVGS
jgi:transcriptional regulator with XRE-family HTH domain